MFVVEYILLHYNIKIVENQEEKNCMIRLFENHRVRRYKELDGVWDFVKDGCEKKYKLPVPGCWEQHPDMLSYRGKGEFSKKVYVNKNGNVRLEFKGVSHTADVFFDGEKIAHHYNAFTPFSAVVTNVAEGEHEIKVLVDNSFTIDSTLHIPNDYYTYGGITRPVALENIPDVYIKYVHFTPFIKDEKWHAKIEAAVSNLSEHTIDGELLTSLEGNTFNQKFTVEGCAEKCISIEAEFENVKAWSDTEPNLYMLYTTISLGGTVVDDLIERVGFRVIEIKDRNIYLNGEKIFFKGFNRHEDYAVDGCAVSLQHMVGDLDMMADMGANALRTSHYPNDERMLDLCDERGILVWEENHARGQGLSGMQRPNFEKQCADCIDEMIENHYNHPSVIIWGILNECASDTAEGREIYKKQFEQIKSLDKTRPTSFASNKYFKDLCLDLVDIISMNVYTGWYTVETADWRATDGIDERIDKLIAWANRAAGANKPFLVTEFGAAAMYGYRDKNLCRWSEEFQAKLIGETIDAYE